jgi:hypothetical protein
MNRVSRCKKNKEPRKEAETPKNIKNSKLALIGLSILFAVSLVIAGGRKPKIEPVNASLRQLSANEVMEILQKFPEMVPDRYKDGIFNKGDKYLIEGLFHFREVEDVDLLKRLFPTIRFIKASNFHTKPPLPYLMAVSGNKRYEDIPSLFNRLLLDNGLEVNNKNIIELAKAFVIITFADRPGFFPKITFLEGKRIKKVIGGISYEAKLKVRINEQIEEWYFNAHYNQFRVISRGGPKGLIKQYDLPISEGPPQKQGKLELDTIPKIEIATTTPSKAYVEWEGAIPHYYLIVDTNGHATNYQVKFELSGFPASAENVYLRVIDTIWAGTRLLTRVEINDSGKGSYLWTPPVESTGICKAGAGFAADTNPPATYRDTTSHKELTLEKVITGSFTNDTTYKIYFCHQVFAFTNNQIFSQIA